MELTSANHPKVALEATRKPVEARNRAKGIILHTPMLKAVERLISMIEREAEATQQGETR